MFVLKILIADDEMPARDELKYILSFSSEIEIVGEASDASQVIEQVVELKPDIIFLDINMRGMNGLDAAHIIHTVAPTAMVVFATAYDEYALKAFEIGAIDYVLKPFDENRIYKTIERIKKHQVKDKTEVVVGPDSILGDRVMQVNKLAVEKDGRIIMISYDEILYAYAYSGTARIVTDKEEIHYHGSLVELEERLKTTYFLRVHKSYLVNMDKVQEVIPWFKGTYWLKLKDGKKNEIPVSKSQIKNIKNILGLK